MVCCNCDSEDFFTDTRELTRIMPDGVKITEIAVEVCRKCGTMRLTDEQDDNLLEKTYKVGK